MLLLPGLDGTGELFAPLRASLAAEGHGGDDVAVVRYANEVRFEDYVETVSRLLPDRDAAIVAESFSGPIALALMARNPARFRCAVLSATFAVSPVRLLARIGSVMPAAVFAIGGVQRFMQRRYLLDGACDPALVELVTRAVRSVPPRTIKARLAVLAEVDVRALLPRVTVPVLYLRATRDRVVPAALSDALVRALPNCTVQTIDSPHMLLQARPLECARAIRAHARATT